jgi:hypothetical protein
MASSAKGRSYVLLSLVFVVCFQNVPAKLVDTCDDCDQKVRIVIFVLPPLETGCNPPRKFLLPSNLPMIPIFLSSQESHVMEPRRDESDLQQWTYEGSTGPDYWASLIPAAYLCRSGEIGR